jgi:hypothetical protein
MNLETIPFDILDILLDSLEYTDCINLFLTSPTLLQYWNDNKAYLTKKMCRKLLQSLGLESLEMNIEMDLPPFTSKEYSVLSCLYFEKQNKSHLVPFDYLVYMVNNRSDCTHLFRRIASVCKLQKQSDLAVAYMLIHGDLQLVNIILETFHVPIDVISFVLKTTLSADKVERMLTYIVMKHHFPRFNSVTNEKFQKMLKDILYSCPQDCVSIFTFVVDMSKRYNLVLDYTSLINACIETDNVDVLDLLLQQNHEPVLITSKSIKTLVSVGQFHSWQYILDNILGHTINARIYIRSIYDGLFVRQGALPCEFHYIDRFLTNENKLILNRILQQY